MLNVVKNTCGLPTWFCLQNYPDKYKEKGQEDLRFQLDARIGILGVFNDDGKLDAESQLSWDDIRENGLAKNRGSIEISELLGFPDESIKEDQRITAELQETSSGRLESGVAVHPLNLLFAWSIGERAKTELGIIESESEDCILIPKHLGHMRRSYDLAGCVSENVNVTLDLNATDSQILAELKILLPTFREKLGAIEPSSIFKKSDPKRLVDYRILPLIDLKIWELIESKRITNSVLAAALFPDGSKGEDDLRKTIAPFMERVMNSQFTVEWQCFFLTD